MDDNGSVALEVRPLTNAEVRELQRLEGKIKNSYLDMVLAINTISERELYRETHSSLNDYLRDRWDISPAGASRYLSSARAIRNIQTSPRQLCATPSRESHVRPLTKLPEERQVDAWQAATETASSEDRGVTAADVESAVESLLHSTGNGQPECRHPARLACTVCEQHYCEICHPDHQADCEQAAEKREEERLKEMRKQITGQKKKARTGIGQVSRYFEAIGVSDEYEKEISTIKKVIG